MMITLIIKSTYLLAKIDRKIGLDEDAEERERQNKVNYNILS